MSYQYGVSFNCYVGGFELGGCDECNDIAFVGKDKEKLIAHTEACDDGCPLTYTTEHEYVGCGTTVGGDVIGVFLDVDGSETAVLIEQPICPTVIE